jgi:hypothetical protein
LIEIKDYERRKCLEMKVEEQNKSGGEELRSKTNKSGFGMRVQ